MSLCSSHKPQPCAGDAAASELRGILPYLHAHAADTTSTECCIRGMKAGAPWGARGDGKAHPCFPQPVLQCRALLQSQLCVRLFIISDCICSGNLYPGCVIQRGNATRYFPGAGLLKRALLLPAPQDRVRKEIPTEAAAEWFLHLLDNAAVCVLSLGESGASTQLRGFFVTFLAAGCRLQHISPLVVMESPCAPTKKLCCSTSVAIATDQTK